MQRAACATSRTSVVAQARHLAGACLSGNWRAGIASWWLAPACPPVGTSARGLTCARSTSADASYSQQHDGADSGAPRIVVVGGGFGGLNTAIRLTSLFWPKGRKPQVTLIDQSDRFVFKPLLYELLNDAASSREVAPRFEELLAPFPAIKFVQGKVLSTQPEQLTAEGGSTGGGAVQMADGSSVSYDWLVLALGAQVDGRGVPGVMELATPFNALEDAIKIRDALTGIEQLAQGGAGGGAGGLPRNIVVVGAGYAGVELACVIAERLRSKGLDSSQVQVNLVTPGKTVMEGSPAGQREASEQVLASYGVNVITGTRVRRLSPSDLPASTALPTAATITLDDRPTLDQNLRQASAAVTSAAANVADAAASAASSVAAAAGAAADALRSAGSSTTGSTTGSALGSVEGAKAAATGGAKKAAAKPVEEVEAPATAASTHEPEPEAEPDLKGEWQLSADLVVWTAGSAPATKAVRQGFPFPTNAKGSVKTDAALRVLSHARVFALGDVSVADQGYVQDEASINAQGGQATAPHEGQDHQGTSFPATAQVAFQQADYAAWNLWAAMMGRSLLPFRYQHLGSMMSLGAYNAAVELPVALPASITSLLQSSPLKPIYNTLGVKLGSASDEGGVTLEGPLAAVLRRAAYLYRQPTNEQRLTVATEWIGQASNIASGILSTLTQRRDQYAPPRSSSSSSAGAKAPASASKPTPASYSNGYKP